MSESNIVAPVLSSTQDESDLFQKYTKQDQNRSYLNAGAAADPTYYTKNPDLLIKDIERYYSIKQLAKEIKLKGYQRVTLQFPDGIVADSAIVAELLEGELLQENKEQEKQEEKEQKEELKEDETCKTSSCCKARSSSPKTESSSCCGNAGSCSPTTGQKVWILADTAYSSCCIDSVAAQHVHADCVVHFGDACLNSIDALPALYVFGKPCLDLDKVVARFKQTYQDNREEPVVLMADATYSASLKELYKRLSDEEGYANLGYLDIKISDSKSTTTLIDYQQETNQDLINQNITISNRQLITKSEELLQLQTFSSSCQLFHITEPQAPHLLYLTSQFSTVSLYIPTTDSISTGPFPSLTKRYRAMHISRTSGTIGILVNTLSLSHTKQMINLLSKQIREAGKKSHFFVVGKPNVAKLANFESVECWCVIGCPQGGIILDETNDFYRPIVTPFELGVALGLESWTGEWDLDFETYLERFGEEEEEHEEQEQQQQEELSEDEAPEFDPVTGKYISTSKPLRQLHHLTIAAVTEEEENQTDGSAETSLVKKFSSALAIKSTVSTSAQYLQTRHWTGLGSDFQNDDEHYDEEGALVEEGLERGVARGYGFDVSDMKNKQEK